MSVNGFGLFLLLFVFSFFADKAHAQIVNMQNALSGNISDGPGMTMELRQEKKSGNSDAERLAGQGNFTFKRPEDIWLLVLRREYSVEEGQSSSDNHFYHLRYRYKLDDNWGLEAYAQQDADRFRRSQSREVYGAGPRFQTVLMDRLQLAVSAAYMHESEQFNDTAGQLSEPDRITKRISNVLFLSYELEEWGTLANVVYYQPEIGRIANHRTLNELSLSLKINKYLSYKFTHSYAYNHRPAPSVEKNDKSFLQSLVLKI